MILDMLFAVDIGGWTLFEIAMMCLGLLLLAGAVVIIIRARNREE